MEDSANIHINELLTYGCHYIINSSCISNIKKIMNIFFSNKEIISAKKLLWTLCSNELEAYTDHKSTDKRSSSEAHLDDIFQALNELDSINKLPTFVAKNIDIIPYRQQEENNIISIINRICKLTLNV